MQYHDDKATRVRGDRKKQGVEWPEPTMEVDDSPPVGGVWGWGEFLLNFRAKMPSFMHFIAKNYLWPETAGTGGLNETLREVGV